MCYSDIVFAIDSTNALGIEDFVKQKDMIKALINKMGKCLYGVVVMGRQGLQVVPFDSYESITGLLLKIDQLPYSPEDSNIGLSLEAVLKMFQSRPESKF